jgi:hypothetical protein
VWWNAPVIPATLGNTFLKIDTNYSGNKEKELTNRIVSNEKDSAEQRKQFPELKDNPQNGRKSFPVVHWIKD